jgi:TolB protein
MVVLPFGGPSGPVATGIVRQDLDFSDRFKVSEGAARAGEPLNLALWKERGADWVLTGEMAQRGSGLALRLVLHDAVYRQVKADQTFALPAPGDAGFRMAVHVAADEVVRWVTGTPGAAASRIAYVASGRGSKEIYLVDSDGENVQRVTSDGSIALSPAWSRDVRLLAYTSYRGGTPALWERNLATGRDRLLSDRAGINITPAYSPDGSVAFAATVSGNTEVVSLDAAGVNPLTRGRGFDSLSPTFSPDGARIAFVSNRLGEPQVYVMARGGEPRLVSEYTYGRAGYSTSPAWSPRGPWIAYHTRAGGSHQIALVGADGNGRRLLTNQGTNEDPSWAPDGRHVVFASPNRDGGGLFVLDTVSGRIRPLVRGRGLGLPDWSPSFGRAAGN